jgi:hypothetical protein
VNLAVSAIERHVDQIDKWADENAAKKDYSGAGSQQKSAVDLHAAVAIIKNALVPHVHDHPSFRHDLGDECEGCLYDADLKRVAARCTCGADELAWTNGAAWGRATHDQSCEIVRSSTAGARG